MLKLFILEKFRRVSITINNSLKIGVIIKHKVTQYSINLLYCRYSLQITVENTVKNMNISLYHFKYIGQVYLKK